MSLFRLLTDFDGRIGLARFWLGSAIVTVCLLAIRQWAPALSYWHSDRIIAFAHVFALFPWAALAAKRASDRGSAPLFGILLVCAIVLPGLLKPLLSTAWAPSLDAVMLIAWLVALVDLGLMPSAAPVQAVAEPATDVKAASWTHTRPSSQTSTPPILSP